MFSNGQLKPRRDRIKSNSKVKIIRPDLTSYFSNPRIKYRNISRKSNVFRQYIAVTDNNKNAPMEGEISNKQLCTGTYSIFSNQTLETVKLPVSVMRPFAALNEESIGE